MIPKLTNILESEVKDIYEKIYIGVRKVLGNVFCKFGKYELAMNMYFKALHLGPRRADLYFSMGRTLYFMGNAKDAIKFFEKSLQWDKENPTYLHWLFQANLLKDKYSPRNLFNFN